MSIMERRREFGVMIAVGTTRAEMVAMIAAETCFLSLVGTILGNIFGLLITLYFGKYGFDLRWLSDQQLVVNGSIIQMISYPSINWRNNALISCAILSITMAVALIPMRNISRLSALEALTSR